MSITAVATASDEPDWVREVLQFWFVELSERQWFSRDAGLDAQIRQRFLPLHGQLLAGGAEGVVGARAMLAAVIVLDQFSRNMFRGDARAFAADPVARRLTTAAAELGVDAGMSRQERLFLYMPLQHSENREDQARSVKLVAGLGNPNWTDFALRHQRLIERFGRFPQRNAALGRPSTAAEMEALQDPATSF